MRLHVRIYIYIYIGGGGGEGEVGDERKDQEQLKMIFWNVCGWTDTDRGEVNRGVRMMT